MKLSARYGSHLLVLLQALAQTYGPVLELGMGAFSTPLLHNYCALTGRELVSYDNDASLYEWAGWMHSERHVIGEVTDWDKVPVERPWDVAFIDHSPDERRAVELERLRPWAQYVVVHDADFEYEKVYHLGPAMSHYKHLQLWKCAQPHTAVLSNFRSLDDFWGHTWPRTIQFSGEKA